MSEAEVRELCDTVQGSRKISPSPSCRHRCQVASPGPSPPREAASPGPPGGRAAWEARATLSAAVVAAALRAQQAQATLASSEMVHTGQQASTASIASFAPVAAAIPAGSASASETSKELEAADGVEEEEELQLNDAGAPMRPGADGITLYCGRYLDLHGGPGRCGPFSDPQCDDCWRAQVIARDRRNTAFSRRSSLPDLDEIDDSQALRQIGRAATPIVAAPGSRSRSCTPKAKAAPKVMLPLEAVPLNSSPGVLKALSAPISPRPQTPKKDQQVEVALGGTPPEVLLPVTALSYAPAGGDYTPLPPAPALRLGSLSHRPAPIAQAAADATSPRSPSPFFAVTPKGLGSTAPVAAPVKEDDARRRAQASAAISQPCLTAVPRALPPCLEQKLQLCKGVASDKARVLGSGAYAVVCLVKELSTGQARALKVVATQPLAARGLLDQARNEAFLQKTLRHPNIASALDSMEVDGHLYMVLEYAGRGTLKSFTMEQHLGRLAPHQVAWFMRQILDAVAYLHSDGVRVLHRDIKATNILLASDTEAKLTDFGWSTRLTDHELPRGLAGTTSHMAPEVVQNFPHGKGADLWSCGVLLYEVAVGALPFADNHSSCRASYQIPVFLPAAARDMVSRLLRLDVTDRGCAEQLLRHPFLKIQGASVTRERERTQGALISAPDHTGSVRTPPAGGQHKRCLSAAAPAAIPAAVTPAAPTTPSVARTAASPVSVAAPLPQSPVATAVQKMEANTQQQLVSLASPVAGFRTRPPATPASSSRGLAAAATPVVPGRSMPTSAPLDRLPQDGRSGFVWSRRPVAPTSWAPPQAQQESFMPAPRSVTPLLQRPGAATPSAPPGRQPLGGSVQIETVSAALTATSIPAAKSFQKVQAPPSHSVQRLMSMPAQMSFGGQVTVATSLQQRATCRVHGVSGLGHSTLSVATARPAGA